jgi:hypothetical protein
MLFEGKFMTESAPPWVSSGLAGNICEVILYYTGNYYSAFYDFQRR